MGRFLRFIGFTVLIASILSLIVGFEYSESELSEKSYIVKFKDMKDVHRYNKKFKYLTNTVTMSLSDQELRILQSDPNIEYIEIGVRFDSNDQSVNR